MTTQAARFGALPQPGGFALGAQAGEADLVVSRLAVESGRSTWEEFLALDDLLTSTGRRADRRLGFQASYPIGT